MENYKSIIWEQVGDGIGLLTLNRPQAYNSINGEMLDELEEFWQTRLYDLDTRVIILKGAGEKGFCAGLDMKYTIENASQMGNPAEFYKFQARLGRLNLAMRRAPQPIIALVHGAAAGLDSFTLHLISIISQMSVLAAYYNIDWLGRYGLHYCACA